MRYLKENTATRVTVGPFIDKTDGFTPEIALTVTSELLTFIVDDAGVPTLVLDVAPTASGGNNDMVHITSDAAGMYDLELTAANTNYTGRAILSLNDVATHLPVWHEFQIVSANVYDSMFTDGDLLNVSLVLVNGAAQTATLDTIKAETVLILADTADIQPNYATATGVNNLSNSVAAVKVDTAAILVDTAEIGAAGVGLSNIGTIATVTNLTNLPTIPANWLTAAGTAADFTTEIQTGLATAAGVNSLSNDVAAVKVDTAAILVDTAEIGAAGVGLSNIGTIATVTTLTNKTGFSLAATGLDAIASTATGMVEAAKAIWDRVLSGATHNIASSAGRRLRTLQTGGAYEGGAIWVDTVNGTAGTVDDENGVVGLPVDTWADALTLSTSLGLKNFHIANGSTVTLSAASANYFLYGHEWTLALGGFSVASTMIIDATVSGTGTGAEAEFEDCIIGTMTIPPSQYYNCSFTGTQTLVSVGNYRYVNCQSGVPGASAPTFALGTGDMNVEFRRWSGGINLTGIGLNDVITISGEMGTIDLGSATAGTVEVRGTYKAITNGSSGVTVNLAGAILGGDVADVKVVTDALTSAGATNLALSAAGIIGGVTSGTPSTVATDTDLTGYVTSELVGRVIIFTGGTANGQAATITAYTSTNGVVGFAALTTAPASSDTFVIV